MMDIEILYRDKWLVACIKPAGVLSEEGGMPELLRRQLGCREVFCVHRLDRAVSGVMVYALNRDAAARLSQLIAERNLEKSYLAVIQGCPAEPAGTMRDLLFKDSAKGKSYVVRRMRGGVKEAALEYALLGRREELSLVRIKLLTGRSHQIRVQFSSRGMPLVGDVKYGSRYKGGGLALWSASLGFTHPFTGRPFEASAPPPATWPWTEFNP